MRTALFCVDWKTENSVSYQIRVGKSIKSNPVCTSLGWHIRTSIPCFTLSATHASRRSGVRRVDQHPAVSHALGGYQVDEGLLPGVELLLGEGRRLDDGVATLEGVRQLPPAWTKA